MSYPRLTKCMPDETRHNPFLLLHRALRFGHCSMLAELGAQDFGDDAAASRMLARLVRQLALHRGVAAARHAALAEALAPHGLTPPADACVDHAGHLTALSELESLVRAVTVAAPQRRRAAARSIYRCHALYAAADMTRLDEEETVLLSFLHQVLADDALRGLELRCLLGLPREELQALLRLLLPAVPGAEAEALLAGLQRAMDPQLYATTVEPVARPLLEAGSSAAA